MHMIRGLILLLLIFCSTRAYGWQNTDTLKATLQEIEVVGYEDNRSLMETPGAITTIDTELINAFSDESLLYSLNTVPGLRMEQRAPGSYRIAIRGSALRSPFGVRNVKVYWNGIPFTEPTGSTPLNLLDIYNMQQVEVIRGPGGSIYGAGNGGVLLINSMKPYGRDHLKTELSTGSYGLLRYGLGYYDALENGRISFKYSGQESDGYREQSFFNRRVLEVSGDVDFNERRNLQASMLYMDLNYGIPGGLTREQFQEDPRQARQGNAFALGSKEANASIKQEGMLLSLKYNYDVSERFSYSSSAYGMFTDFRNPFNLDYKRDSRMSGGIRSLYSLKLEAGDIPIKLNAGNELSMSSYTARNFENDYGKPGALNFDDEIRVKTLTVYASMQADLRNGYLLTGGLSYNYRKYDIHRLVTNLENDETGKVIKTFDPQVVPRVGLSKRLSTNMSLHGSISFGFSPPTIEEVRTNEGSINLGLEAERGTNYEIGLRGYTHDRRLNFDVTTFFFALNETIVQKASERGTVLFQNAGNTDQFGAEAAADWLLINRPAEPLQRLRLKVSYTYHHFRFDNYRKGDSDYSGNALTGVAPHILVSSLKAHTASGFYALLSYNFTDEIPLNDANTVYSESYHLLQTKAGFKTNLNENFSLDLHAGIDNLLNERYSLGNDLNAFGERYFQPAAERNWFAGIKIRYDL